MGSENIFTDGSLRPETKFLEFYASPLFGKGMEYFTPSEMADVTRLYMWEAAEPENCEDKVASPPNIRMRIGYPKISLPSDGS